MDPSVKAYFDQVVRYNVGDVKELLKLKSGCAGPLLTVVANGIDIFGGMYYGFRRDNSKQRSIDFMTGEMGFTASLAELMYVCVRCAMNHEGMTKAGLKFFVHYDCLRPRWLICLDGENERVSLNVVEFAHAYLCAVDKIIAQPGKIVHYARATDDDKDLFLEALTDPANDVLDFVEIRGKIKDDEQKEIESKSSSYPNNS